ncbi:TonB-dependent receptor [Niabella ginsengisoli]|uniref:TonB-dependent receptor n=1 Tax=Niabella ginsengisoli TaxID=522298 RepID=A0ABS9SF10_9BACT|nr:carboxypeptidase regulatory-like domain-containing protein [Niabella ginsengisoli]MCH5596920.1 TonB-dependent receptor [Niabella ginsengisoli]
MIALFTIAKVATAQTVNGKITDNSQVPMPNASVSLLNAKDSSLKKINAADKEGNFLFEHIAAGKYILMATSIGYAKTYSAVFEYDSISSITQHLIIDKSTVQMTGVVVTAKRPPIEMKAGKTVVNVDGQPTNAGLNVLEILEKSPGVSVDADGNVSLQGKGGVMILIDDKPTYLSGTQLAAYLKSIQASGLNQIEIMTSPPAKYDAEGGSGVINIKTKKGTIKGFNGNLDLNYIQGLYPKYNGGANLNYRNNKLNIFGSYNGGVWESLGTMAINRNFYKDGAYSDSSAQITNRKNDNEWHNTRVGMDYYFTDNDVAGIVIRGGISEWEEIIKVYQTCTARIKRSVPFWHHKETIRGVRKISILMEITSIHSIR